MSHVVPFSTPAWLRQQQLRSLAQQCLALCFGDWQHHNPRRWETAPVHVWKGGSVSQMPGTGMAGDNLGPWTFQGGLALPQRGMKPARELILLRKPPHFSPAIWSVKQGMGNGWVIPKEHQPSSQTFFSNALHFNVQVGIPAKTFLGSCSSIPGTWQRDTQWCWRCSTGNVKYLEKCSKCKAKIKYFWLWWSTLTFVKCLSTRALFITTSYSPAGTFENWFWFIFHFISFVLHHKCPSSCLCSKEET